LFSHLERLEKVVGLFKGVDDRPHGSLFEFSWRSDHVVGEELLASEEGQGFVRRRLCRFGLSESEEDGHTLPCSVEDLGFTMASGPDEEAEAEREGPEAAALAEPSTSPPSEFAKQLGLFMRARMSPKSSRRGRRRNRSPALMRQFVRVWPGRKGCVTGLWLQEGLGRVRVVEVEEGEDGVVRGRKVMGEGGTPSGEVAWEAWGEGTERGWRAGRARVGDSWELGELRASEERLTFMLDGLPGAPLSFVPFV